MVTLNSAEKALKTVYLDVLTNQLNTNINPFLGKIKSSTKDVWGKEVKKLAPIGINGGIAAGTEEGNLPEAAGNNYLNFVSTLKNLYGTIEISDKAIRSSENNAGAFVNLLNDEMEGLVKAATFNFGRMLYGNGSGKLGTINAFDSVSGSIVLTTKCRNIIEGMVVDIFNGSTLKKSVRITAIDRETNKVFFNEVLVATDVGSTTDEVTTYFDIYAAGSKDNEISGLEAIFSGSSIYGVERTTNNFCLKPFIKESTTITDDVLQEAIDALEMKNGSSVDFIVTTPGVRRKYMAYLNENKRSVNTLELEGGMKAISFNGIPVIVDRFCPEGTIYLLNTKQFTIHQLCDWRWLEGDSGKVIKQNAGKPTYSATLVKYAELICDLPGGQAKIFGITE